MTRPKNPARQTRLLLVPMDGPRRTVSDTIRWLERIGENVEALARDLARGHYLHALTTCSGRRVLDALRTVTADDDAALHAWAVRWWLDPVWALAWARETVRLNRPIDDRARTQGHARRWAWCPPNNEHVGAMVDETRPARRRRLTARHLARRAPLKASQHFVWLATYQLGTPYQTIARSLGTYRRADATPIVRDACHRLAAYLGVPLRPARRGRPRRGG